MAGSVNPVLWAPDAGRVADANVTRFIAFINDRHGLAIGSDYAELQAWTLAEPAKFWAAVWDFCGVLASRRGERVLADADQFPGARWFPEARLNFAENLLRFRDDRPAVVEVLENGRRREYSFASLYRQVAQLAAALRAEGVEPGDRVAGFMANVAETVIAMLATTSIGAIWSSCSPDFGVDGVHDRLGQIRPKVLFATDGYCYNGKACDTLSRVADLARRLGGVERIVVVPVLDADPNISAIPNSIHFNDYVHTSATELVFEQLPFDHPLCIMYSSGTTGMPKCILHSAGGALLQHLKEHQLLTDLKRGDIFFYYTTCGWMMWNWLVSGLATGATLVLYDGSPFAGDGQVLLNVIDREGITVFGVSARYIAALEKAGHKPAQSHSLASVKTVLSTGSPLSPASFDYIYRDFKRDVCLSSISGGTDLLGCFVAGCPILPVRKGEMQAVALGMAVEFWNEDGNAAVGEGGELVCTQPFPSCPIGFWNDPDGSRLHAVYFERFAGVWAHGDYGEIRPGGGVVIHGRSDAVLNPGGVRIGTAEIYRQVECIDEVVESLVIGQQWQDDIRIVLFLRLREGVILDEALRDRIRGAIRQNTTPRHVPAKILQVPEIPRTISGKIVELAVRDVVHGRPVGNTDALANPQALEYYRDLPELRV